MRHKAPGKLCFKFLLALSEVNYNFGRHHFGGMEAVREILDHSKPVYRNPIKNSRPRKYHLTS